jgi:hypothetical protein
MGSTRTGYGERRGVFRILVGKPGEKSHWEYSFLEGMIIL